MHIFDILDAWGMSMATCLTQFDVAAKFERSSVDQTNPSFGINLRRGAREIDLLVWDSGEAELLIGAVGGAIEQTHFPDVRNRIQLAEVLAELTDFVVLNRVE